MFERINGKKLRSCNRERREREERESPLSFFTIIMVHSGFFHYLLFFNLLSTANLFQLQNTNCVCVCVCVREKTLNDRRKKIESTPITLCFTKWLLTKNANEEWSGESRHLSTEAHKYTRQHTHPLIQSHTDIADRFPYTAETLGKQWGSTFICHDSNLLITCTAVRPNANIQYMWVAIAVMFDHAQVWMGL